MLKPHIKLKQLIQSQKAYLSTVTLDLLERVNFESTCCEGVLSLQSKTQTANGHEIGLGISSHYHHASALHLHLFIFVEYEFLQNSLPPKKELHTAASR